VVEVIVGRRVRPRRDVRIRRCRLDLGDITRREGLTLTTPVRTLLDLALTATSRDLEIALNEALVNRLVTATQLGRRQDHRGARALGAALRHDAGIVRSEAERRLRDLIARAGLPAPSTNVRLAGFEVDCFWPEVGLVVEVDSVSYHATPRAFRNDRAKEAALHDVGLRLLRVTPWEITRELEATAVRLAMAIAAGSRPVAAAGSQAVAAGSQAVAAGSQALAAGSQAVAAGSQAVAASTGASPP
jgi:very-short-patch-repair endonuclease